MPNKFSRISIPALYLAQALVVLSIAFAFLHLYSYDLSVPLNYSGDSIVILMYIKGIIQDGWPTNISQLSAPFSYPGAAFPILTSVDWAIIKSMSMFSKEPGILLNGFWLLSLVLSSWSATYAAFQLGLNRKFSLASGVLYGFLPFALVRNVGHLNLVYYLVPILCLLAIVIATRGEGIRNVKHSIIAGLVACVLQGFNYVYFSFFSVILFFIAALISFRYKDGLWKTWIPACAIILIVLSTAINFIPTYSSWQKNGSPSGMGYKSAAEAEIFGAKIRRIISPHPQNPVPILAKYAFLDASAKFPNENENTTARLGPYGTVGFILLIIAILRGGGTQEYRQPTRAISALGIATILIITVGGFGAVINLISVPDIRAYNRFSVFLAFFCIVISGLWLQAWVDCKNPLWKAAGYIFSIVLLPLSLYDQLLDGKALTASQTQDTIRANEEKLSIKTLERIFPRNTAILQLPFSGFPMAYKQNSMEPYDHARPYIWSHHLSWSWPSFSKRHSIWQSKIETLSGGDLTTAAIYSGFSAIWIDRFAFFDDGHELISSLTTKKVKLIDIGSPRFAVLDLREAASELRTSVSEHEFRKMSMEWIGSSILIEWGTNFYGEERNQDGHLFRWSKKKSSLQFRNTADQDQQVCLSFKLASGTEGTVRIAGAESTTEKLLDSIPASINIPMTLRAGKIEVLNFSSNMPKVEVPSETRDLYFYLLDLAIEPRPNCENR